MSLESLSYDLMPVVILIVAILKRREKKFYILMAGFVLSLFWRVL